MEEKINFIDKKLVHKVKDENVHIYNMRRALPREINVSFFETILIPKLEATQQEFVKEYYVKGEGSSGEAYILRTIPFSISFEKAQEYLKTAEVEEEERIFLRNFYQPDSTNSKYILQKSVITEDEENRILKILDGRELHISDQARRGLSEIFEKVEGVPRKEIYFANVHIDQNHSYFFEHPQEHVPGMILIEVARQMSMVCAHVYGKVPLDAIFMLTKLDNTFSNYTELNYPIKVRAKLDQVKTDTEGAWSFYFLTFTFYQRHKVTCTSIVEAMIVNQAVFKKIRRDKEIYDQLPRFCPIEGIENNISLRDGKQRYLSSIIDVSHQGFMLKFPNDDFIKKEDGTLDETKSFEFFMFFDKIGFIHGNCDMKWSEPNGDGGTIAGFLITKMNPIDTENLKEAMKFHFRLKDEREIL